MGTWDIFWDVTNTCQQCDYNIIWLGCVQDLFLIPHMLLYSFVFILEKYQPPAERSRSQTTVLVSWTRCFEPESGSFSHPDDMEAASESEENE